MAELSRFFLEELKAYEPYLNATLDHPSDSIHIWAERPSRPKVHELSVKREFGELYPELERRTLKKLRDCDIWKKFGTGKAYDDYLAKEEEEYRIKAKSDFKKRRETINKEYRDHWRAAIWNAQNGRVKAEEVIPYAIPKISLHVSEKKNEKKEIEK